MGIKKIGSKYADRRYVKIDVVGEFTQAGIRVARWDV
jgi:hypothetical protein